MDMLTTNADYLTAARKDTARLAEAEAYVQTRFYPPLPVEYGVLAVAAVDACRAGDGRVFFDVTHLNPQPRGANYHGEADASTLVEALRLWHLVDEDDDSSAPVSVGRCERCGYPAFGRATTISTGESYLTCGSHEH